MQGDTYQLSLNSQPPKKFLSPTIRLIDQVAFGYDFSRTILKRLSFLPSKVPYVRPNVAGCVINNKGNVQWF